MEINTTGIRAAADCPDSFGTDDAGNGARGLRALPSTGLLALLRDRYGLDATGGCRDLGGSCNLNLRVSSVMGWHVVRVYRPHVDPARLGAIQHARRVLSNAGVPCAEPMSTRAGEPWAELDGRLVEVEGFIEADARMDSWERLEAGLPCLGRIHEILRCVEAAPEARAPLFANHVEAGDALEWALRASRRVESWGPSRQELELMEAAEELARRLAEAETPLIGSLPRQLAHGDFWDNNVFFRHGRIVLVADFDFMGERPRIDDLALTLYYTHSTFSAGRGSAGRLTALRTLVDAYDSGLEKPLSPLERCALPLAVARQPLWAAGKWLALLDDEQRARQLAAELADDVEWALEIARDPHPWRAAFVD